MNVAEILVKRGWTQIDLPRLHRPDGITDQRWEIEAELARFDACGKWLTRRLCPEYTFCNQGLNTFLIENKGIAALFKLTFA